MPFAESDRAPLYASHKDSVARANESQSPPLIIIIWFCNTVKKPKKGEITVKRKTLAILVALVLLMSALSLNAFAAKENFITLKEVEIGAVASPAAGTEPLYSAETQTANITLGAVEWYQKSSESDAGTKMTSGDKFTPGYYYAVCIQVNAKTAASFKGSSGVTATVNGKAATVSGNEGIYNVDTVKVTYTFPMCLGTVAKFDISLTAPAAGAKPAYTQVKGTGYESNNSRNNGAAFQNGISWHNDTDNSYLYPAEDDKFEAGKTYTARVSLLTTEGYRLASSYTVTVNGKAVTSGITKVDNECLTVDHTFTVPAAQESTTPSTPPAGGTVTEDQPTPPTENPIGVEIFDDETPSSTDKTPSSGTGKEETPEADTPVQAPAEEPETAPETGAPETAPETEGGEPKSSNLGLVLAIVIPAILLIGGAVAFILLKKKK